MIGGLLEENSAPSALDGQSIHIFGALDDKSECPSSGKDEKTNNIESSRTTSSSPLLDVGAIPSDDLCPYCNKQFRRPRVLDCLHSMCEDCIIAQLDGRRDGGPARSVAASSTDFELESSCETRPTPPGVIRCPTCHQESHVGNDVRFVSHLLLDFVRLHDVDTASPVKGVRNCRACKSEQQAMAVCKQCASDLCKNCYQAHRDMKLFEGHTVLTYTELSQNPTELPREPVLCITHPQMPYTLLCATCEAVICNQCHQEHADAQTHNVIAVDERVGALVKNELSGLAAIADNKAKEAEKAVACVPERQSFLLTQYEAIKTQIDEAFVEYHTALDAVKDNLLRKLGRTRDDQETELNNLNRRVNATTVKIGDAIAFTNRLVEKGTCMEVLASRKKIRQQLCALTRSMPDLSSTTDLVFNKTPAQTLYSKLIDMVGDISTRLVVDQSKTETLTTPLISDTNTVKQLAAARHYPADNSPSQTSNSDSLCTTPAPQSRAPGAIGMERRNKPLTTSTNSSIADFADGWPPSSMPPEPASPPPLEFQNKPKNSVDGTSSFYNWPSNGATTGVLPGSSSLTQLSQLGSVGGLLGKQTPMTTNNLFMPRTNSWMSQPSPVTGTVTSISNSTFPLAALAARQRLENPILDPAALRMLAQFDQISLHGAFGQPLPALGRHSQLASPLDSIRPVGAGLLREPHLPSLPAAITPSVRSALPPRPNTGAAELALRCHVGGLGSAPGQFSSPHGFCLGQGEEIVVADTNNHRIQVFTKKGEFVMQFGNNGPEESHLSFPKKVVACRSRAPEGAYVVVDRGENRARLQVFTRRGEFVRRLTTQYIEYVSAITTNEMGHLIVFSSAVAMFVIDIELEPQVLRWADCSKIIGEPSDVAVYKDNYYVTDYKSHCIVMLSIEGEFLHRFGSNETTPYPIGIDVSTNGDVLVADAHGNHFHIFCCTLDGQKLQDFECSQIKVSRCVGLRLTGEGYLVSISKHNNNLLIFGTVFVAPSLI